MEVTTIVVKEKSIMQARRELLDLLALKSDNIVTTVKQLIVGGDRKYDQFFNAIELVVRKAQEYIGDWLVKKLGDNSFFSTAFTTVNWAVFNLVRATIVSLKLISSNNNNNIYLLIFV